MSTFTKLLLAALILAGCVDRQRHERYQLRIDYFQARYCYLDEKWREKKWMAIDCMFDTCRKELVCFDPDRWRLNMDSAYYYEKQMRKTENDLWAIKY